jgi:MoaA/NifB/PqqE/SkfB family radical SAM enzyme
MKRKIEILTLELIRKCPSKCLHCSTFSSPKATDFISFEKAKSLIEESIDLGLKKLILSGGEPLLYPWIIELIQFIKNKNVSIIIYTSGSLLDESNKPNNIPFSLLQKINRIGIERYNLSLHSSVQENHDKFMDTEGSWKRAVEFIGNCKKLNEEIQIHTVLTKYNFDNLIDFSYFLSDKGIKTIRILKLVPQGRAKNNYSNLEPSSLESDIFWGQVKKLQNLNIIDVKLGAHLYSLTNNTQYECSLDSNKLTVTPDGTTSVCPAFKGLSTIYKSPNINNDSLNEIVSSEWRDSFDKIKLEHRYSCPAQVIYNLSKKQKNYN